MWNRRTPASTPTAMPLLGPTHTTPSSHIPLLYLPKEKLDMGVGEGVLAREGPLSCDIRKRKDSWESHQPFALPPNLWSTFQSVFEPLHSPLCESLVMILAISIINGNSLSYIHTHIHTLEIPNYIFYSLSAKREKMFSFTLSSCHLLQDSPRALQTPILSYFFLFHLCSQSLS